MIINDDALLALKKLDDNSIDSLVTDPPAGIGFMNKEWDTEKRFIPFMTEVFTEVLRVLKPGAHGLVWAIPRTSHRTAYALEKAGFEIRDVITHIFGSGFPKSLDVSKAIDKMKSPEAKQWSGFGTALKPASEHWLLVRKPLGEATVAKNVLKHGTGALNIDASRIEGITSGSGAVMRGGFTYSQEGSGFRIENERKGVPNIVSTQGRFPANLIVDETAVEELDEQSGYLHGSGNKSDTNAGKDSEYEASSYEMNYKGRANRDYGSQGGGASRFFYCAKASKRDRGEGNTHPTVKASKLMEYLITLVTPPGGTVLDPFMGSGSTGVAAKRLGFEFIGIEKEAEYFEIATKRLAS